MSLADRLAAFCVNEAGGRITPAARRSCRRVILDFCGVALAGSTLEPSAVTRRALLTGLETSGGLRATVVGRSDVTWAPIAALLNGAAAHSVELDDLHAEASLHPGAIVIPTALALAEATNCDSTRFLHAVVAGYEAIGRVGLWITPSEFYKRGFHPTGVAGVFGATAAAAVILNLSSEELARAFGIASDLSTGLMEFGLSGSWSKRMHTGWPAHGGCVAALLAGEGFLGSRQIFESPSGVIFAGAGRTNPVATVVPAPDAPLAVELTAFKRHACCRFSHTALDILLDLKEKHHFTATDIEAVTIGQFRDGMFLAEPAEQKCAPHTMVDAQFSLQYAAAVALLRNRASVPEFLDQVVSDPETAALAQRIHVVHSPRLDELFPKHYASEVEITLRSGRTLRAERDYTVGDVEYPLSDADLENKFYGLAELAVAPEEARGIVAAVDRVLGGADPKELALKLQITAASMPAASQMSTTSTPRVGGAAGSPAARLQRRSES